MKPTPPPDPAQLTCQEVNRFLVAYLDDALPAALRATFDEHVAACACCRGFLDQYHHTIVLAHAAGQQDCLELPEELVASILAFLRRHA